jgi:hypothetical protein
MSTSAPDRFLAGGIGAVGLAAALLLGDPALAVNSEQTCQAATLMARAVNADIGVWLDRQTRNDGVDVICPIRTVRFKRFLNLRTLEADWRQRRQEDWSRANCADRVWRPAIDEGWIIMASFTTASGERADLIAVCKE